VLTAEHVQPLTEKSVKVVPTETIPQGVAALLAFDYEADFETNAQIMNKAKSAARTIEITRAVRSTQINDLKIKKNQAIGLLDGDLLAVGSDTIEVLNKMLAKLNLNEAEVITIYYGADSEPIEAEQVSVTIREQYPQLQVEIVRGGQPHYNYIISIE
jgi:dihydroxyacetone kinase-like predicted kinase